MNSLYLLINILTVAFPIALSFDKKVNFKKHWGSTILASSIIAIPFLIWDVIFTEKGFWGFTDDYLVGFKLAGLPIEEILFFFTVPFACLFIYECVRVYFPKKEFLNLNFIIYLSLFALLTFLIWSKSGGWYSVTVSIVTLLSLGFVGRHRKRFPFIPLTFLLCLIPFLMVNGVLTGMATDAPVVWYSEDEFSSIRFLTIPIEDFLYAWNLIVLNCLLYDRFRNGKWIKEESTNP